MALYVCIVLAAEFAALSDQAPDESLALGVIWGTTVGLALAQVFAFNLAARLFAGGRMSPPARTAAWVQLGAAVVVAVAVTIPFLLFGLGLALDVAGYVVATLVGVTAYLVSRSSGAGFLRSIVDGLVVLAIAQLVVSVKVALSGH